MHRASDLYADLGVRRTATQEDLRRAYHWVRDTDPDPAKVHRAEDAYAVLGDPHLRAVYDGEVPAFPFDDDRPRGGVAPPAHGGARPVLVLALIATVLVGGWRADVIAAGLHHGGVIGTDAWLSDIAAPGPSTRLATEQRVLPAPVPPPGAGGYAFERTLPGGAPVTFDPCTPIHYVVSHGLAVTGGDTALVSAVAELSADTGLSFVDDGQTDEAPVPGRRAFQPGRYGDRWAPVLIAWTDASRVPRLAGNVVGLGGAAYARARSGRPAAVSGTVYLDAADLQVMAARPDGALLVRDVILHELGHLVGLAHVDDPGQIMRPAETSALPGYGDGDRRGLALLGRGNCS